MQARRSGDASALVDLLAVVRDGLGGARVPRGGAGIGTTALLGHVVRLTDDLQVAARMAGVKWEMDLEFVGLRRAFRESAGNTSSVTVSACRAAGAGLANLAGGR
jgi:hypothetical protein